MASKLEKNGKFFSNFNPFPSMPSEATGDRKKFQYLQIVFNIVMFSITKLDH